ncbi:MAG TPA: hypothetical protein P5056_03605 [Candidatus Paceibacterota bacterium]|nr:hypothetical protein [Candidatus Paceibacterota bacterium]
MKPRDNFTQEQADLLQEFKEKADKLGLEYFAVVGDPNDGTGASVYSAKTPESAARNAREAHIEWEKRHSIDPEHSRA